jgi:hypothetical protein
MHKRGRMRRNHLRIKRAIADFLTRLFKLPDHNCEVPVLRSHHRLRIVCCPTVSLKRVQMLLHELCRLANPRGVSNPNPVWKAAVCLPRRIVLAVRGLSYSPDLHHWGSHKIILEARRGGWWDANKIGLCSPPIETANGWLTIYHGVRQTASGSIYRLGPRSQL